MNGGCVFVNEMNTVLNFLGGGGVVYTTLIEHLILHKSTNFQVNFPGSQSFKLPNIYYNQQNMPGWFLRIAACFLPWRILFFEINPTTVAEFFN